MYLPFFSLSNEDMELAQIGEDDILLSDLGVLENYIYRRKAA